MDGIEWKRAKWSALPRAWFFISEYLGAWFGDHLVADHPEIKAHLARHTAAGPITMIPYGADALEGADATRLSAFGLEPGRFVTVIARAEPENSILEIVSAFSRARRKVKLVVLGHYDVAASAYHRRIVAAASDELVFAGAIYDAPTLSALRYFSRLYVHGHQVGGTNPSLVEALGARNPILAHDNRFNRWVAGPGARYFEGADECARQLDALLADDAALAGMSAASRARHGEAFTWSSVLDQYERLLERHASRPGDEALTGAY
jgi:glycosyltransferase involved in cell wall biosynthesis